MLGCVGLTFTDLAEHLAADRAIVIFHCTLGTGRLGEFCRHLDMRIVRADGIGRHRGEGESADIGIAVQRIVQRFCLLCDRRIRGVKAQVQRGIGRLGDIHIRVGKLRALKQRVRKGGGIAGVGICRAAGRPELLRLDLAGVDNLNARVCGNRAAGVIGGGQRVDLDIAERQFGTRAGRNHRIVGECRDILIFAAEHRDIRREHICRFLALLCAESVGAERDAGNGDTVAAVRLDGLHACAERQLMSLCRDDRNLNRALHAGGEDDIVKTRLTAEQVVVHAGSGGRAVRECNRRLRLAGHRQDGDGIVRVRILRKDLGGSRRIFPLRSVLHQCDVFHKVDGAGLPRMLRLGKDICIQLRERLVQRRRVLCGETVSGTHHGVRDISDIVRGKRRQ